MLFVGPDVMVPRIWENQAAIEGRELGSAVHHRESNQRGKL